MLLFLRVKSSREILSGTGSSGLRIQSSNLDLVKSSELTVNYVT